MQVAIRGKCAIFCNVHYRRWRGSSIAISGGAGLQILKGSKLWETRIAYLLHWRNALTVPWRTQAERTAWCTAMLPSQGASLSWWSSP
jgi:hypothetical protein